VVETPGMCTLACHATIRIGIPRVKRVGGFEHYFDTEKKREKKKKKNDVAFPTPECSFLTAMPPDCACSPTMRPLLQLFLPPRGGELWGPAFVPYVNAPPYPKSRLRASKRKPPQTRKTSTPMMVFETGSLAFSFFLMALSGLPITFS